MLIPLCQNALKSSEAEKTAITATTLLHLCVFNQHSKKHMYLTKKFELLLHRGIVFVKVIATFEATF